MGHDGVEEGDGAFADVVEVSFVFESENFLVIIQLLHFIRGCKWNGLVSFVNNAAVDIY